MLRKFFTLFGTIGILVGGIVLIAAMGAMRPRVKPEAPEITPPTVFFTVARERAVTLDVFAQGEVRARTDITLTAEVAGRVAATSPAFVDGGAFEAGDLLIKIDDADYRLAVTGARARVAEMEERLKREEAEAVLARRDYEELGREQDPSELALRLPQLAQAKAAYEGARADYRAAELDLQRTEIRPPFKGRVRSRRVGEGQYVSPGAELGRIFSTDVAEVRLALTDADLAKLGLSVAFVATPEAPGPAAILSATIGGARHQWIARIERTDGAIDPATRQISAFAVVADPYGAGSDAGTPLAIGLFVDARIEGRAIANAFVLPRSALYGRDTVYVIADDDTLIKRSVTVVAADRDTITITSGLADGERVATSPLRGADEGDRVTPVDPAMPDRPQPSDDPTPQSATAEALEGPFP